MKLTGLDRLLASRLGLGPAEPSPAAPGRWSREARATAFFYLFFVGPTVALVSLLAPGGAGRNELGVLLAIVGAYGVALVVIVAYTRLPDSFFHGVLASASVLLSVAFYYAGESRPAFAIFYAWIALWAGLFFRPPAAAVQIAIAAGALGVAYALEPSPLGLEYALLWIPLLSTPVGIVLFLMHRQRRVAAALEASEERLRQAEKLESIGRLAGGIAHDFNNLLTVILGYAGMLERRRGQVDRFEVHEIVRAAERASSLTAQLLAFGRRQVLRPAVLDPNEVVRGLEPFLRRLIDAHVELRVELDPAAGTVTADPTQLEQVLINLVTNARDAMPGGGRVTIATGGAELPSETVADAPPGRYVVLSVGDHGSGIAPELLEHLFEPFFTTKEVGAGTGLGLASVHGIVAQSGGFIEVVSEVGSGTTFSVYLPRASTLADAVAPPVAAAGASGGSETILLVEDEQAVRDLARTLLEEAGYAVLAAASPSEALERAREAETRVDLLVSDVVMPGFSGGELAARLVAEHGEVPALFVSGYASSDLADQLAARGSRLIPKPFAPEVLLATVRAVLDETARPGGYVADGRSAMR